jgi:hypothetical protein
MHRHLARIHTRHGRFRRVAQRFTRVEQRLTRVEQRFIRAPKPCTGVSEQLSRVPQRRTTLARALHVLTIRYPAIPLTAHLLPAERRQKTPPLPR